MREKLNNNPLVQVAILACLLLAAGFFLLSTMGGGGEGESEAGTTEATVSVTETGASATTTGATPSQAVESTASVPVPASGVMDAPPPPQPVTDAFAADRTVVLLFVRDGGIDDRLVRVATEQLRVLSDVASFVVPAREISHYAAITEGVGVDRVPALIVVRPKHLNRSLPTAEVSYGFQSGQSVVQAVVDAGYEGPTVDYHP